MVKNTFFGKTRLSIEGYRPMESKKNYVLFLKPNYTHPEDWIPTGVTQGKYSTIENDDSKKFEHVYLHY